MVPAVAYFYFPMSYHEHGKERLENSLRNK